MQAEWKLPSQLVTTDRKNDEGIHEFFLRHEQMRRITAESDLIKCLDFIDSLKASKNTESPHVFLIKYLDKTINN